MADASAWAVRCSTCLQMVSPDLPHSCYDAALHAVVARAVAQERARVLADVIAVVSSDAHAMTFQTLGQYRTDLLTRLRAMEGHTDG